MIEDSALARLAASHFTGGTEESEADDGPVVLELTCCRKMELMVLRAVVFAAMFQLTRGQLPAACSNLCPYAHDHECDDGSSGGTAYCPSGTDSADCGTLNCFARSTSTCAALATSTLAHPACVNVERHVAESVGTLSANEACSPACAELWLSACNYCGGTDRVLAAANSDAKSGVNDVSNADLFAAAFESSAAAGVAAACAATAGETLATAPRTITVSGSCNLDANGEYVLQPVPMNGKPHYATTHRGWHIFWTPHYQERAAWLIGDDADDTLGKIMLISDSETPIGSAIWLDWCNDEDTNVRLQLTPRNFDSVECSAALTALSPRLIGVCCGLDSRCEESGNVPSECSVDCAHLWGSFTNQCLSHNLADPALAAFFTSECGAKTVALTVLDDTAVIHSRTGQHYFSFEAVSGMRYDAKARVGVGSGKTLPCTHNGLDEHFNDPARTCDIIIASGQWSCEADFCAECGDGAHMCDLACGFLCVEDGVTFMTLVILPPGATDDKQAVATEISARGVSVDRGLGFTAAATGTFAARVHSAQGTGPVMLTVTAVGSALERSPRLEIDGLPHPLTVNCVLSHCAFGYSGASAFDGDGSGFDLVLPDAVAGRAYACRIELPPGQTAAQIEATFYQAGAAAGAAGFAPVLSGPMGEWTVTPMPESCSNLADDPSLADSGGGPGSCAEFISSGYVTCAADFCPNCGTHAHFCDRSCGFCGHHSYAQLRGEDFDIRTSFGIHPGGSFPRFLTGTWVAPASGAVLLRLVLNCDVVFFADVEAEGCDATDGLGYVCGPTSDGTDNSKCASELRLTVTPGAYFDESATATEPVSGSAVRTDTIVITRADVEAKATAAWQTTPTEQRTLVAPPTLDEMLISGSDANALLISLFTVEQQPYAVFPLSFALLDIDAHRRLQKGGDKLVAVVDIRAPSVSNAHQAEQRLIDSLPGADRSGTCELSTRTQAVNVECCNEPSEDCSSGRPSSCNIGCAEVLLPFFEDCSAALGQQATEFDGVVSLCHAALGHKGRRLQSSTADEEPRLRRLQMGGDQLQHTLDTHAVCGLGSTSSGCTAIGQTKQQVRVVIGRADVEAQAATILQSQDAAVGRRLQTGGDRLTHPIDTHAPTLDEMLVSGTPANALLSRLFINEQQPQVAFPSGFALGDGGKHRRLQSRSDHLYVTVDTHAATPSEANRIVQRLAGSSGTVQRDTTDTGRRA